MSAGMRRLGVCIFALLVSAALFHASLAALLVTRGDEYVLRGMTDAALVHYRRALFADAGSVAAADRYASVALAAGRVDLAAEVERVLSGALAVHRRSALLLEDRGVWAIHLRRYERALSAFKAAAAAGGGRQDLIFAGWAARRAGRPREAAELWERVHWKIARPRRNS